MLKFGNLELRNLQKSTGYSGFQRRESNDS